MKGEEKLGKKEEKNKGESMLTKEPENEGKVGNYVTEKQSNKRGRKKTDKRKKIPTEFQSKEESTKREDNFYSILPPFVYIYIFPPNSLLLQTSVEQTR